MGNTRRSLVRNPAYGIPFEFLHRHKYELYTKPICQCVVNTERGETPCTPPRARDLLTGRIVVPLTLPRGQLGLEKQYPQGTLPSVDFGRRGVDIDTLRTTSIDELIASGRIYCASDTPFASFSHAIPEITVSMTWPDHGQYVTTKLKVPLRCDNGHGLVDITTAQLLVKVYEVVTNSRQRCHITYLRGTPQRRCWSVAEVDSGKGLLPERVFIKALHHVSGVTFQPELHIC